MTPDEKLAAARESFSGKGATEAQLKQAVAIADILHVQIEQEGSFKEPLAHYAHAFALGETFDALRAERIIRDTYKAVQGQTMYQRVRPCSTPLRTYQSMHRPAPLRALRASGI